MLKKRSLMAAAIVATLFAGTSLASAESKPLRVGFVQWTTTTAFAANLVEAAKKEAAAQGITLDVQSGNGDLAAQVLLVQQFISQNVDVIIVNPSNSTGIVPAIKQANAAGIPVFAVNQPVDTSTGAEVVTYVGVNDVDFGKAQGELLAKALGGKGNVAYIMGVLGGASQLQRKEGMELALKVYPDIKIVDAQAADWDNAKALTLTQDFLSKYPPGTLDAIVGQSSEAVVGAEFARNNGRTDVMFILGDYPADARAAIKRGTVHGTVNQDPRLQGKAVIVDVVNWMNGKKDAVPTPTHYLELPIVTKDNVETMPAAWGE